MRHRVSRHAEWRILQGVVACSFLMAAQCPSEPTPDIPDPTPDPIPMQSAQEEVEPNSEFAEAEEITFDEEGVARVQGVLTGAGPETNGESDRDYFRLPAMARGDRIIIDVDTPDSDGDTVMGVFEELPEARLPLDDGRVTRFGRLIFTNDDESSDTLDPYLDQVFRADSETCVAVIGPYFNSAATEVDIPYELTITLERGGTAPDPARQDVVLYFGGIEDVVDDGEPFVLPAFDPADIDPIYEGQTDLVVKHIIETVVENFDQYDVQIFYSFDEGLEGDYSLVLFGQEDPAGLGRAFAGTDPYNADPNDGAIVFTNSFKPGIFSNTPDAAALGRAIGNVASHEIGHLLGLYHASGDDTLMEFFDSPDRLLTDERFQRITLDPQVFPLVNTEFDLASFESAFVQDAPALLEWAVGRSEPVEVELPVGAFPIDIEVTDIDGDGDVDVIVALLNDEQVAVLRNLGGGEFDEAELIAVNGRPIALTLLEDPDGGLPDVATVDAVLGLVTILENDQAGTLAVRDDIESSVGLGATDIETADLNEDGLPDIAAAVGGSVLIEDSDGVAVLLAEDDGFAESVFYEAGITPESIALGDLNGDGAPDIAVGNLNSDDVSLLLNNGDGTFGNAITLDLNDVEVGLDVLIEDLDGDGDNDLAALASEANVIRFAGSVHVFLNEGDATFTAAERYLIGEDPVSLVAVDIDADGDLDLMTANRGSNDVSLILNAGDGTFSPDLIAGVGDRPLEVFAADLDGIENPDFVVTNSTDGTLSILFNPDPEANSITLEEITEARLDALMPQAEGATLLNDTKRLARIARAMHAPAPRTGGMGTPSRCLTCAAGAERKARP